MKGPNSRTIHFRRISSTDSVQTSHICRSMCDSSIDKNTRSLRDHNRLSTSTHTLLHNDVTQGKESRREYAEKQSHCVNHKRDWEYLPTHSSRACRQPVIDHCSVGARSSFHELRNRSTGSNHARA